MPRMPRRWNPDAPTPPVSLMGLRVRINRIYKKLCSHINAAKEVVGEMTQDFYESLGYLFFELAVGVDE